LSFREGRDTLKVIAIRSLYRRLLLWIPYSLFSQRQKTQMLTARNEEQKQVQVKSDNAIRWLHAISHLSPSDILFTSHFSTPVPKPPHLFSSSRLPSKMPPLDPVSQIFETQFINAWELFEAHKFDEVSTSPPPQTTNRLTSPPGQQPKRKAARTTHRSPPQSRPAHHPRTLAQRSRLARRGSTPHLRDIVFGKWNHPDRRTS
jgi:hypothetical protein